MSGSEDMIEILVGERDRALREAMALERERDEARAEVERLAEAERLLRGCCSNPLPLSRWLDEEGINYCSSCSEQDGDGHAGGCWWVRRDEYFEKRRESGDER